MQAPPLLQISSCAHNILENPFFRNYVPNYAAPYDFGKKQETLSCAGLDPTGIVFLLFGAFPAFRVPEMHLAQARKRQGRILRVIVRLVGWGTNVRHLRTPKRSPSPSRKRYPHQHLVIDNNVDSALPSSSTLMHFHVAMTLIN